MTFCERNYGQVDLDQIKSICNIKYNDMSYETVENPVQKTSFTKDLTDQGLLSNYFKFNHEVTNDPTKNVPNIQ